MLTLKLCHNDAQTSAAYVRDGALNSSSITTLIILPTVVQSSCRARSQGTYSICVYFIVIKTLIIYYETKNVRFLNYNY